MTNLKTAEYHGADFFHTIKKKINCEKDGEVYESPLYKALEFSNDDNITLQKETLSKNGKSSYISFGNVEFNTLNNIWKENHNLYEILREERKPYFDIEYTAESEELAQKYYEDICDFIGLAFKSINIKCDVEEDLFISASKGIWKSGIYEGLPKYSFHIVVNNGYKFASVKDAYTFKGYMEYLINTEHNYIIDNAGKYKIDMLVYTKNRAFKLPYQSKIKDPRPQLPQECYNNGNAELINYLISYGIKNYNIINVEGLEQYNKERIRNIKESKGINTSNIYDETTILKYHNYIERNNIDNYHSNLDDIEFTPEFFIKCIYNDDNMPYDIYMSIGSALKRCCNDDEKAFKLWDNWTKKCSNYNYEYNKIQFAGYSRNTCGYSTLLNLAKYCNEYLNKYEEHLCETLFNTNLITNKEEQDNRYINIDNSIYYNYDNIFIKSAMGSGKSYHLKELLKDESTFKNVVYLSSKRAFASSMSNDFSDNGFKNYLDDSFTGYEKRVIISLESLYKYNANSCDLLIIDESESIYSIISSETLIKNNFESNIQKFTNLIKNSKLVLTMDAYLSNRSIEPILVLREDKTTKYIDNKYQYEERECYMIENKIDFIRQVINKLKEGKKCCVVLGSRKVGDDIMKTISKTEGLENIKTLFHNIDNQLEYNANVNEKWNNLDLLMYSPTISCGISFTKLNYDNLFIYAVNKGSCLMRDTIQAHKRVRQFNTNIIYACINEDFKGFCEYQQPTNKAILEEILGTYKKQLFQYKLPSIKEDSNINWIYNIHINNILERNINDGYTLKLFNKFCEIENIKIKYELNIDETTEVFANDNNWIYKDIKNIDIKEYKNLKYKIENNDINNDEIKQYFKFIFNYRTIGDNKEELFNHWCDVDYNRKYYNNIKKFKTMLYQGNEEYIKNNNDVYNLEYFNKSIISFIHIEKILKKLKIIDNNTIDTEKEFNTLDFDELTDEYSKLDKYSINQLFDDKYYRDKNKKGEKIKFTSKTMMSIVNKLLKEYFNYEIKSIGKKYKTINGKKSKLTVYKIQYKINNDYLIRNNIDITKLSNLDMFKNMTDEFIEIK